MKCKDFSLYLKEWLKNTPTEKRLDDKFNIRPQEINDHIDTCDNCFHKLMEAYESPKQSVILPKRDKLPHLVRYLVDDDDEE